LSTQVPAVDQNQNDSTPLGGQAAENLKVRGEAMAVKVKELLHEGNVRRIMVKDTEGHTVIEIPITAGVVAAVVAPALIAVAALAAMASDWEIEVHRV
jgi:hypothetical protein